MLIERRQLANGLALCLAPDPSNPLVAVSLWYRVGSADERPGRTGLAHLFEHLMFQGSAHVEKGQHIGLIQAAGGRANAATGMDRTYFYERLPAHQLELALWLEAERLGHLLEALDQAKLDNQRDVVRNERRLRIDNQPYGDDEERINQLLYPEHHPYGHEIIGSMEDLAAASLDDVAAFFNAYYAPNNAVLSIAGGFEPEHALDLVTKHFGRLRPNPDRPAAPAFAAHGERATPLYAEVTDASVRLGRVYLAYPIPPFGGVEWDALEVAADLLARGRGARLYAGLVRRRLAHDVAARTDPLVGDPARLTIQVTAPPHGRDEVLAAAVMDEVDRLAREGPSEDELERVRNLRRTEFASSMERAGERADRIAMYSSLLADPERVNHETERYLAVDGRAVRKMTARFLRPDRAAMLVYRPMRRPRRR